MPRTIALASALDPHSLHQFAAKLIDLPSAHTRLDHLAKAIEHGGRRTSGPSHLLLVLETFANHEVFFLRMRLRFNQKGRILLT